MQKFDLPWRQISTQGERDPRGEEPAPAGVSTHEARGRSFETRAPDSASALPEKRAPPATTAKPLRGMRFGSWPSASVATMASARRHHIGVNPAARNRRFPDA